MRNSTKKKILDTLEFYGLTLAHVNYISRDILEIQFRFYKTDSKYIVLGNIEITLVDDKPNVINFSNTQKLEIDNLDSQPYKERLMHALADYHHQMNIFFTSESVRNNIIHDFKEQ